MMKKFDCVEMKHKGAQKLQKEIIGLSRGEELEFWRKKQKF